MSRKKNMTAEETSEQKKLMDLLVEGIPEISENRKKELVEAAKKLFQEQNP